MRWPAVRGVVNGPFAVINADDFYGRTAFSEIYDFLAAQTDEHKYAMVGYRLKNTVTEFGSVARGVCEIENGMLTGVTERTKIFKKGRGCGVHRGWRAFLPAGGRYHRVNESLGLLGACARRALGPHGRVPEGCHSEKSAQV